jgi:hypothetical protein
MNEEQARAAAAHFFAAAVEQSTSLASYPWDDPKLVVCEACAIPEKIEAPDLGAVRDLGGDRIDPADYGPIDSG